MKKILAMVLALCLMFCAVAASAEGMVDKIKEKGTLVLGTEATYGPYEFLDDNANPIGCDIWLAQQIADELQRHVKSIDNALQRVKRKLEKHLYADDAINRDPLPPAELKPPHDRRHE